MFSALESRDAIDSARVLDLYAGSGALGLEALSRGAGSVVLVESDAVAAKIARDNAAKVAEAVGVDSDAVQVRLEPVATFLPKVEDASIDLVFLDPPYELSDSELNSNVAEMSRICARDAVVVVERSTKSAEPSWPECFTQFGEKHYGDTTIWWARAGKAELV